MYHLSWQEKDEYCRKFPQLAPEVVEGDCRQSTYSDMFAVGGIIYQITDQKCMQCKKPLLQLAENCQHLDYKNHFSAAKALMYLQKNNVHV